MNKFFTIALSVPAFCLLFSCSKDSEPEIQEDPKLELYYTYKDTTRHLADNDVITIKLGDTFSLSADVTNITGDNLVILGKNSFNYAKTGDSSYQFTAQQTGLFNMGAFTYDQLTGKDFITYFNVDVSSFSRRILIMDDPVFNIDVGDESLKDVIQTELEDIYVPGLSFLELTCNTVTSGDFKMVRNGKETTTITGTFTTSSVFDWTDIMLYYNNTVYAFIIEKETGTDPDFYVLKQDLTGTFRAKYPGKTINEVIITTLIAIIT